MRKTFFVFILVYSLFAVVGCSSAPTGRTDVSGVYYIEPASIEAADYAVRERIGALERQIADARVTVGELRASGERIRDVSRRSGISIQEIIEQMEALSVWIDWAVSRIQYLESLLEIEVRNTDLVEAG